MGPESNYAVKRIMHLSDMQLSGVYCTGILFRRKLAKAIRIVDTNEPRITAVCFTSNIGPVLLANVYMPSDRVTGVL